MHVPVAFFFLSYLVRMSRLLSGPPESSLQLFLVNVGQNENIDTIKTKRERRRRKKTFIRSFLHCLNLLAKGGDNCVLFLPCGVEIFREFCNSLAELWLIGWDLRVQFNPSRLWCNDLNWCE